MSRRIASLGLERKERLTDMKVGWERPMVEMRGGAVAEEQMHCPMCAERPQSYP